MSRTQFIFIDNVSSIIYHEKRKIQKPWQDLSDGQNSLFFYNGLAKYVNI